MTVLSQDVSSLIRVLVLQPTRVERVRLIRPLRAHYGRNVEVCEASTAEEAEERLSEQSNDVVLLAEQVGEEGWQEIAARLTEISPETATILVVAEDTPDLAAEVAHSVACDYVVRSQVNEQRLARAISGAIRQIHLQRGYREMVRRMNESHDQMDYLIRALSHDMNANFMVMENSFSKLQRSLEPETTGEMDAKEIAAHVRACMTESRRFLNDLVGLARTGRVEMDPELADTDGVVEEVLFEQRELLADRKVAVEVSEGLPKLWCNRHRLKQIITNLIRNVLKHGLDPNEPRLTIHGDETCEQSDMAVLRISDNGSGIPEEWHEEIFMPGRRVPGTPSDGTGMGLAIVRKIVQHYGGTVCVETPADGGTTFAIQLPSTGSPDLGSESFLELVGDPIPADRRLDHDTPHDDPRLHSHRTRSRRKEPRQRLLGSD